jgi:hypothetical protein
MSQSKSASKKPSHYAYQVRESGNGQSYWTRIGAAWEIKDGFKIQIDAVPLDGTIVLQIPKAKEEAAPEADTE